MPTIPVLQEGTVKPVGLKPQYRSTETPAGAFGEGYAEAGQQIGRDLIGLSLVMQRQKEEADATRVNAAAAEYNQQAGLITDAAYQTRGKDAMGVVPKTMDTLSELAKTTSQGLSNDQQRDKLLPHLLNVNTGYHQALSRHASSEGEKLAMNSATARIESAYSRVSKNWTQPELIVGGIAEVEESILSQAKAQGWSKDATDAAMAEAKSGLYASILRTQDAQGAHGAFTKTFETVHGELTGKDLVEFSKVYEHTSDLIQQQANVATIMAMHPDDETSAITEARSTLQGKEEENAVSAIKIRFAERQSAKTESERVTLDKGWGAFVASGGSVDAIPRGVYADLLRDNPQAIQTMMNEQERIANRSPGPTQTDFKVFGDWMRLSIDAKIDPNNDPRIVLAGHVRQADMEYAMKEVEAILNTRAGVTRAGGKITGPSLDEQNIHGMVATSILENPAIFNSKNKTKSQEATGAFTKYVRDRTSSIINDTGKNPTREEGKSVV